MWQFHKKKPIGFKAIVLKYLVLSGLIQKLLQNCSSWLKKMLLLELLLQSCCCSALLSLTSSWCEVIRLLSHLPHGVILQSSRWDLKWLLEQSLLNSSCLVTIVALKRSMSTFEKRINWPRCCQGANEKGLAPAAFSCYLTYDDGRQARHVAAKRMLIVCRRSTKCGKWNPFL